MGKGLRFFCSILKNDVTYVLSKEEMKMPRNQEQRMFFAFFSQLFFIQPFVRTVFKTVFRKDIEARKQEMQEQW